MPDLTRIDSLARIGYFARAVVYGLLGYLAFYSRAEADQGPEGAFDFINDIPGGDVMLYLLVGGLIAYGVYKLVGAVIDIDRKGDKPKGMLTRGGQLVGGIAYMSLALAAYRFASDAKSQSGGPSGSQDAAGTILDLPLGGTLLAIAGVGFLLAAAVQGRNAITAHFMRAISPAAPAATRTIGRIGLAARTIVFALIGWSLFRAAWQDDEGEVRDIGGVLEQLRENDTMYTAVAIGLIVFAVFSAIEARYRIVPRVDVVHAAKAQVHKHT